MSTSKVISDVFSTAGPNGLPNKTAGWIALGIVGAVLIYVVYRVGKTVVSAAAHTVGGAVSGNNTITQNQTDWSGQPETAYQGKGILGTLGAAFNSASGGGFSSIGNAIGSALSPSYDPNATPPATNRDQVVTQNYVTDIGTTTDFGVTDSSSWD